ncbi:TraB/VirB10 family protein [Rhodanobacter denitrificans]|uniref:TraB/VirB10 family protein n=1 Tax=Rhodanobacter denitrificans TaxID=666685 RepID=UPI001F48BBAE|nr:TraB/VirB10 family protein [Rhodanobacter denitrificans]UJJ60577.1 TraB/VirB10 family protein [Rhodanobacter denitrificans]
MFNPKKQWDALSATRKQYVVWGIGIVMLMVLGTFIFGSPAPKHAAPGAVRLRMANELLPAGAARDLGVSSLATGLAEQARDQKQLFQSVDKLRQQQEAQKRQGQTSAERDSAQRTQEELAALRKQIETLQQGGVAAGATAGPQPPTPAAQGDLAPMAGTAPVSSFRPSGASSGAIREIGIAPAPAAASAGQPAVAGRPEVPPVPGTASREDATKTPQADNKVPTQYLPSGSMMQVVSITGMDAPTGRQAMKDPLPMLFRVKASAVLPNRYRADVRECFVVASGHGDLASERAYLRSTSISCIRTDKRVIDVPVEMVAIGPDGKAGIRGRLVSKQGQIIAKAAAAGVMQSIAQAFSGSSYRLNFGAQNQDYGTALEQGVGGGVGSAFDRIAKYYLDMADQMFPVVEVDAGQKVTFMLVKGAQMGLVK